MSEAEFQAHVRRLCADLGLLVYHTHDSRRSDPGFPDLVIVGGRGVLYRELKNETYRATDEQIYWLRCLRAAGMDAAIWRPGQLRTDVPAALAKIGRIDGRIPRPVGL